MTVTLSRVLAAAVLAALCAGCATQQEPSAMEWLESEYLKDPGRR